jgi:recombination protein RecA
MTAQKANADLERFREKLGKTYGARVAPAVEEVAEYEVLSTGSITVDRALRTGGLIQGRIHEIVGAPDCAKTTLVTRAAASAQRQFPDLAVGYVDMEGTFDDSWARSAAGLDLGLRWTHLYADDSEDASDQARELARGGLHSLVILDSVGAMESRKALSRDAVDELPGRNAQVITRMVKHLGTLARQTRTTVILVNQLRASIGQFGGDHSAGPKAMQHATTSRIVMTRLGGAEDIARLKVDSWGEPEIVAQRFRARVTRSKAVPVGRTAEFWVNNRATEEYGPPGINSADEYVTLGVDTGIIIQGGGGMYEIPGIGKVKGRPAVLTALRADPAAMASLREQILAGAK